MKPNLFTYATSELSQDAMICWLLEWAKPKYGTIEPQMNMLGIKFIDSLFAKFGLKLPIYNTIEVKRQYKNIDILCIINDEFYIIIEDKTTTQNHSGQLKRYIDTVKVNISIDKILPIYLKTYDQTNYNEVIKNGYNPYLREDFLYVLNSNRYNNDILSDFHFYLQSIENSVNSYKYKLLNEWTYASFIGFYKKLQDKFGGGWGQVSNPLGGFFAFWCGHRDVIGKNGCKKYLLIESRYDERTKQWEVRLCVKIKVLNKSLQANYCTECFNVLMSKNTAFKKPSRFGRGENMTIGVLDYDFRKIGKYGFVDMNETVKELKSLLSQI